MWLLADVSLSIRHETKIYPISVLIYLIINQMVLYRKLMVHDKI